MIFSSYKFIFLFLPITFVGYGIFRKFQQHKMAKFWLALASLYFYSQGSMAFLPYFVFTILFNYLIGLGILKMKDEKYKKFKLPILILGLAENLALLGYYKYSHFILDNVNNVAGTSYTLNNIILPIGISFFTFQLIAYIVDCYKEQAKYYSFLDYLLFITFFPQLIVGPIVHHSEMVVQFEDKSKFSFDSKMFMLGVFTFLIGVGKKILIADPLITYAQSYYNNVIATGFFESWTAVVSYTFAYYFDFSGYGDMAIGIGLLFNIKLPVNFNSPYKARNFAEFWKRWNITLSQFLNDYIFKSVYKFGDRAWKLFLAVLITFVVSGIWHGAGWHFIAWGIVNGIFVCCAYMMILNYKELPFPIAWGLTFGGVLLTRVLFDSHNISQAILVYKRMFDFKWIVQAPSMFLEKGMAFATQEAGILALIVVSGIIAFGFKNTQEITEDFEPKAINAIYVAVIFTLALFKMNEVSNFLYFQF